MGVPLFDALIRGESVAVASGTKLHHKKLDTPGYHTVKTRSLYLTWHWIRTRSWRTDRQTDRIPIASTRSQQYLPVELWRVKTLSKIPTHPKRVVKYRYITIWQTICTGKLANKLPV